MKDFAETIIAASRRLRAEVDALAFAPPVHTVYDPLSYAWEAWCAYLRASATGPRRVVFLGMNPGPWGMAQTGVPFGEVSLVRDWIGIDATIGAPAVEHPKRPIQGFACARSEVSGRRLWGLFRERYVEARAFFADHFVSNYCPLVFMADTGRNITPDKLPAAERDELFAACDRFLAAVVDALEPEFLIGVGRFATDRARAVVTDAPDAPVVGTILHPSPASPAANRDWAGTASAQLIGLGVWRA